MHSGVSCDNGAAVVGDAGSGCDSYPAAADAVLGCGGGCDCNTDCDGRGLLMMVVCWWSCCTGSDGCDFGVADGSDDYDCSFVEGGSAADVNDRDGYLFALIL